MGDNKPLECKHNQGSYPAETVYSGDEPKYQHYRCNGCDIIVETRTL